MTIDNDILTALGINLTGDELEKFQQHFSDTLDERVGLAIFDQLSDEEATELLALQDSGDSSQISGWVRTHVPDYEAILQTEYDLLLGEIAGQAEAIAA